MISDRDIKTMDAAADLLLEYLEALQNKENPLPRNFRGLKAADIKNLIELSELKKRVKELSESNWVLEDAKPSKPRTKSSKTRTKGQRKFRIVKGA